MTPFAQRFGRELEDLIFPLTKYAMTLGLTSGPHDAQDLVASTLESLWKKEFTTPPTYPVAYAKRTLLHVWGQQLRRPINRATTVSDPADLPDRPLEEVGDSWLEEALALLTPPQRAVVVLRLNWEGDDLMPFEQIATHLGCSAMAARQRMTAAKVRLLEYLAKDEDL